MMKTSMRSAPVRERRLMRGTWARASHLALAASTLAGCSGDIVLGDLSRDELSLEAAVAEGGGAGSADSRIGASLGEPDVTFDASTLWDGPVRAGDLDGDGIGEWVTTEIDPFAGTYLHLRYGGPRPASNLDLLELQEGGARLLLDPSVPLTDSVTAVGDVDGDGYGELLVAMGQCDVAQAAEGAYLLYGGPDRLEGNWFLSDVSVHLESSRGASGEPSGSCSGGGDGWSPALGDFDGDGLDDLAVVTRPYPQHFEPDFLPYFPPGAEALTYLFYGRSERLVDGTPLASADATLHAPPDASVSSPGDANGDGRGDLLIGSPNSTSAPGTYWIPGRAQRFSGDVDVAATGTLLAAHPGDIGIGTIGSDIDGDGLADVFLQDESWMLHLFYGQPGLFDDGVDFSTSAATFPVPEGQLSFVRGLGDRDGDGDGELASMFDVPRQSPSDPFATEFAALSGSPARLAGPVAFPTQAVLDAHPGGRHFVNPDEYMYNLFAPGDLDGDGADDVLVTSAIYLEDGSPSPQPPRLNIFYGTPGGVAAEAADDPR